MKRKVYYIIPFILLIVPAGLFSQNLSEKEDKEITRLLEDFSDPKARWQAASDLSEIGEEAVSLLMDTMQHRDKDIRLMAIITLGMIGPKAQQAVLLLHKNLKDERDIEIRLRCAATLIMIGKEIKPAFSAIIKALEEKDQKTRQAALFCLCSIELKAKEMPVDLVAGLVEVLMDVFKDSEPYSSNRELVVTILGNIGPQAEKAVPLIMEAVKKDIHDMPT